MIMQNEAWEFGTRVDNAGFFNYASWKTKENIHP